MTSREFCYWLQGLIELDNPKVLTAPQLKSVKAHLAMVFKHEIDPSYGDNKKQDALNKIHPQRPGELVMRC